MNPKHLSSAAVIAAGVILSAVTSGVGVASATALNPPPSAPAFHRIRAGPRRAFQPRNAGSMGASAGEAPGAEAVCRDIHRSAPLLPHPLRRRVNRSSFFAPRGM